MSKTKRLGAQVIETARFELVSFTVTGSNEFPLDMLRYDRCWPATASDASAIRRAAGAARSITLQSIGFSSPTIKRWESFGWTVTDPNNPTT